MTVVDESGGPGKLPFKPVGGMVFVKDFQQISNVHRRQILVASRNVLPPHLQGVFMKSGRIFSVLSLFAISLFVGACSDDDNPANTPTLGTISGRVTFVGTWPATGNVQASLWDVWPPPQRGPYQSSPVITPNSTTFDYKFEGVAKGTYPAVVVGWRDPANPAGAKVLGIYINDASKTGITITTGRPTFDTPVPVVISDAKMIWTGLDIKADLGLAQ